MRIKKNLLGWIAIILLSLSPIIPWCAAMQPFSVRFSSSYYTFTSLGEIIGLVGVSMFSLTFLLSIRWKGIEDYFGGMNRVYIAHHMFGAIALILLMIHPLIFAFAYMPASVKAGIQYILPGESWAINLGIASLLLMMSLLIITFFVNFRYELWLLTHKFLGLVFFMGAIHGFFVTSDISRNAFLMWYMLSTVLIGWIAFSYKTIFGKFLVKKVLYSVDHVTMFQGNVAEISLKPLVRGITYLPGQFIFINFISKIVGKEVHPFSISSIPTDPFLTITAKAEGDFTKTLTNLQPGDLASIEGAFGRFLYTDYGKQQIWIAGGIGIAPFYSMARSVLNTDYVVDLYYSVRTAEEAVYVTELQSLAAIHKNFRIIPWYTKTQGRLTAEGISTMTTDIQTKDIFVCGPPPMMKSMKLQLIKIGVKKYHIHSEDFSMQ